MKLLIIYGTTEGQTRKIAEFLKTEAEKTPAEVTICDATATPPHADKYDAVIVAASVHMGKYQAPIAHYIKSNLDALNNKPSVFISVSLTAAGDDSDSWKELTEITDHLLTETGWRPATVEQVAGALRFVQYDFFKKIIMREIAKKAGETVHNTDEKEYTDWSRLKAVLNVFLGHAEVVCSTLEEEIL